MTKFNDNNKINSWCLSRPWWLGTWYSTYIMNFGLDYEKICIYNGDILHDVHNVHLMYVHLMYVHPILFFVSVYSFGE